MTKLIVAFCNFANTPKTFSSYGLDWNGSGYFVTTGIYVLVVSSGSVRPEVFEHQRSKEVISIKMHTLFSSIRLFWWSLKCIGVSSLVGMNVKPTILYIQLSPWGWTHEVRNLDCPTHHGAHTDASTTYHTAYRTVSLRMNPRGSIPILSYPPWCSHRHMYNVPYCV
jgi:hypothetical protein